MWIFHAVIQDIDSSNISNCCTMWGAIKSIIFPLAQFIWRSGWNYLMIISNGQVARHVTPRRVKYLCDFTSSEQLWNSSWHPIDFCLYNCMLLEVIHSKGLRISRNAPNGGLEQPGEEWTPNRLERIWQTYWDFISGKSFGVGGSLHSPNW